MSERAVGGAAAGVAGMRADLAAIGTDHDGPVLIDLLRELEMLKSAAAAAQARVTVAFDASQRAAQRAAGVPERRVGQGIASQVALAKRESPARATRYVGLAKILTTELPMTFAALEAGETSEWRASIVASQTIWLTREQRATVDAELAGRLGSLGDREVEAETKKIAYRLDPHGYVKRCRRAATDRRVTLRPAPDTMTHLSALLPVAQGVATYATLVRAADTARATGDPRSRGQVMADTLVELITGQATATAVPVEVTIVLNETTLTWQDEPAHLDGYGPIPAGTARDLLHDAPTAWYRRLHTDPATGRLTGLDPRRRVFTGTLRKALILRDQYCRTPWCAAPIRHADHATPADQGGPTTLPNGQGLCESCNYAKTAPGWTSTPAPGPHGTSDSVTITTPTGHTYTSRPPDLPGTTRRRPADAQADGRAGRASPPGRSTLEDELGPALLDALLRTRAADRSPAHMRRARHCTIDLRSPDPARRHLDLAPYAHVG